MLMRDIRQVRSPLVAGQMLRHRALRCESLYRVLDARGSVVRLEVVDAPGLRPGTAVRLSRAATRAMELVRLDADSRRRVLLAAPARHTARPAA